MPEREPDGDAQAPEDRPRDRGGGRRPGPASGPADAREQSGGASPLGTWGAWIRAHPGLAAAFLGFCLVAVVGLVVSLPRGILSTGRTSRPATGASVSAPPGRALPASPASPAPRVPGPRATETPRAEPGATGPWVEEAASAPSARGLVLVYRHRTLPPGGESRYEWIVQLRGARPVLDGVEVVSWRMEPAAKNGADFVSRDRAADGFPLFGHGPGGWFGVSATVRYQDGGEETLARRIELPD